MYIDIHSHKISSSGYPVILNIHDNFERVIKPGRYSIGLHPWYISKESIDRELLSLKKYCNNNHVYAIGECGLDKICKTDLTLQKDIFIKQIALANDIKKPLILHCVKAFTEVMEILTLQKNTVPVIFHGFNKKYAIAKQLISKGYYLSFGKSVQLPEMQDIIRQIPSDQLFLETDDTDITIEEVFHITAYALGITENSLSLQINANADKVFGEKILQQ